MQTSELLQFGFASEIVTAWQNEGMRALLPIQTLAIRKHRILEGRSLIVSAPTSSGKTFIGELAAVHSGARGGKAIYLVPLKALAEEKYERFAKLYSPYGIRTVISTRDRKEFDEALARDEYDIAIIVYEKLLQLLNTSPSFVREVGVMVFDELQLLADQTRGATVELILTKLKLLKETSPVQIIGLTAVLGNSKRLNEWLGIDLLQYDRRPVELRTGYIWEGVFHYRTSNSQDSGVEQILDSTPSDDPSEVIAALVSKFAKQKEQSLVFVKDKDSARKLAEYVVDMVEYSPVEAAITELQDLEPTESVDALIGLLEHGVAFHHADLTPEERGVVEKYFRSGDIKILFSTSTLAMGVNLPTRNVIIDLEKWTTYLGDTRPRITRLLKSEFENMGGRAGRFQFEEEFGRAITIATRPIQRDQFRNLYWEGLIEDLEPNLWRDSMATTVLDIIALGGCSQMEDLKRFLRSTLTWHLHLLSGKGQETLEESLAEGIHECIEAGMVQKETSETLALTPLGKVISEYGIRVETGWILKAWLQKRVEISNGSGLPAASEAFLAALLTPDGQEAHINMSTGDFHTHRWSNSSLISEEIGNSRHRLLNSLMYGLDDYQRAKAERNALLLRDYVNAAHGREVEKRYHVTLGAVRRVGEHISWVVGAAALIASSLKSPEEWVKSLNLLALQAQYGVQPAGIWLAQLRLPRLGRERINLLVGEGVTNESTLLDAGEDFLGECITKPVACSMIARVLKLQQEREERAMRERQEREMAEKKGSSNHPTNLNNPAGASACSQARVQQKGSHAIVVGVNHGTIMIGSSLEKNSEVRKTATHDQSQSLPPEAASPSLSSLRPSEWRREVANLIANLSPEAMRELFEEVRAAHHNRLRPLLQDLSQALTIEGFKTTLREIEQAYQSLITAVEAKLGNNPLPDLKDDFAALHGLNKLEAAAGKIEEFGGILLKRIVRLVNLLEEFKQTPEEILTSALELAEGKKSIEVTIDANGLQPPGDRCESFYRKDEVLEAFANVLNNAFESFGDTPSPILRLSSHPALKGTAIQISDNGRGISTAEAEKIFRDGFTTKGSTGFGLAHARRVFERHGGSMRLIESAPNRGATFEVVL